MAKNEPSKNGKKMNGTGFEPVRMIYTNRASAGARQCRRTHDGLNVAPWTARASQRTHVNNLSFK